MAALTPPSRDRALDLARAAAIAVVVLWHTVLSVTHRTSSGALTMPNPLSEIPCGWFLTWFLQVMPLFFVVGGTANWIAYTRSTAKGVTPRQFVWSRVQRLLRPAIRFLAVWTVADAVLLVTWPGYLSVIHWGVVLFVPLWFVAMYALVCSTVPWGVRLQRRTGSASWCFVLVAVVGLEVLRRTWAPWLGVITTSLVWFGCHQVGLANGAGEWWRRRPLARGMVVVGLLGLWATIHIGGYDPSLVARPGGESNLLPTTPPVLWAAVLQAGMLALATPWLRRVAQRPQVWLAAVVVNATAMTILCWHMTGHLFALLAWEQAVGALPLAPGSSWWMLRPAWLVASAITTTAIVGVFRRWEN